MVEEVLGQTKFCKMYIYTRSNPLHVNQQVANKAQELGLGLEL